MHYIIDANNLAGKIGILFDEKFDEKLIFIIKDYFANKKIRVSLVFDSLENMGDFYREGYIEIIYTPRDGYYRNADDKIVELVKYDCAIDLQSDFGKQKEFYKELDEVTVVTDDLEIINAVKRVAEDIKRRIFLVSSTDFSAKIKNKTPQKESCSKEVLSEDCEKRINEEFLQIWK